MNYRLAKTNNFSHDNFENSRRLQVTIFLQKLLRKFGLLELNC